MTVEEWLGKDNQIGIDIWHKKYQYNNETFDEWVDRITDGEPRYKQLIYKKQFLPGGRILANRGLYKDGLKVTYSNCYVIPPPEDNIESIFDTASKMARTFSYGGGVGIDISNLAPSGAKVNNTAKQTSGATSFMDLYSLVTGLIGQNGRRGALMISMDCHHPDIEKFIELKSDLNRVTKANISVRVTDDFMEAVEKDEDFTLSFYREETGEKIEKTVRAKELFHKLCEMNWDYAEPGILFWDTIRKGSLLSSDPSFNYAGVNPCAEEPLPAGGSCLLGSMNLAAFVKYDKDFDAPYFDNEEFEWSVQIAIEFLNDILDEGLALHPLDIQKESVGNWRQVGLGIMGLADCLIKMKCTYGSEEAIKLCDNIGEAMACAALEESAFLALDLGKYNNYNPIVLKSDFYERHEDLRNSSFIHAHGLRNSQLLTCAPTGSLSTMLGISGGIEPIFANYYERKTESLHGHEEWYKVYTPIVKEYMEAHGLKDDSELPEWFVTAPTIAPLDRIKMQAVWQSHIDASISSTINLPNEATIEDVENIYMNAWKNGLKGITVYRAGCKREGVLVAEPKKEELPETSSDEPISHDELKRGDVIQIEDTDAIGFKRKLMTGCGSLHCSAFFDVNTGDLVETYLSKGSTGGCNNFMVGLSRMISMSARAGVPIEVIIDQLMSTGVCPSYATRKATKKDTSKGSCCPVAVGYALKEMWEEFNGRPLGTPPKVIKVKGKQNKTEAKCPECGAPLIHEGGCDICKECGYTHCD